MKIRGCACGCHRVLAKSWHLLAADCFDLLSAECRAELVESAKVPSSKRYRNALKAAILESRKFARWRAEVDHWRQEGKPGGDLVL